MEWNLFVIYLATWNLFVLDNNKKPFYFKIFQHNAKACLCPAFAHFDKDDKTI